MARQLTRDHLKAKQAIQRTVIIPADEVDATLVTQAEENYQRDLLLDRDPADSKAKLDAVKEDISERGSVFVFRGVGRRRFEEIVRLCPPTDAQKKEDGDAQWNQDVFWALLCSESCVNSDLTADEWTALIFDSDQWGPGEVKTLRNECIQINTASRVVELGN